MEGSRKLEYENRPLSTLARRYPSCRGLLGRCLRRCGDEGRGKGTGGRGTEGR